MKKQLSLIVLTLAATLTAGAQNAKQTHQTAKPAVIDVKLTRPFKGKIYLTCVFDRYTRIDSATVDGTTCTLKAPVGRTDLYRLDSRPWGIDAELCLEAGHHYTVSTAQRSRRYTVSTDGAPQQQAMNILQNELQPVVAATDSLANIWSDLRKKGLNARADSMQEQQLRPLWDAQERIKQQFATRHPHSLAAVVAAANLLSPDYELMHRLYQSLDTVSYAHTNAWRTFKRKYDELASRWIQGRPAPDFTTRDAEGRTVSLKDFRGRYLLLDFWASWCAPCRKKMKELKAVYPQLQEKGITVCSISGDHDRAAWLRATREDGIIWTNTCDVVPFRENKIVKAYHVTNVPTLFVISPDGRIIAQNPELEEILKLRIKK